MWLSLTGLVAVIILLIIISAFFSGAETALTAASEARMRQLVKRKGNRQAERVEALQTKREQLISTILIGNNAVNIMASALATSAAIALIGDSGVAIATLVMTFIIVLFAEVLPKSYALNHADKLSLRMALPVQIVVWILTPLTWLLNVLVIKLMRPDNLGDTFARGRIARAN
jgi:Mg2+/Co2+ transporter CorB